MEENEKDEEFTLITRKFRKFMKGEKFKGRRFTSRKDFKRKKLHQMLIRRKKMRKGTQYAISARNRAH